MKFDRSLDVDAHRRSLDHVERGVRNHRASEHRFLLVPAAELADLLARPSALDLKLADRLDGCTLDFGARQRRKDIPASQQPDGDVGGDGELGENPLGPAVFRDEAN